MYNSKLNKSIAFFIIIVLCAIIGYDKFCRGKDDNSAEMVNQNICSMPDNGNKPETESPDINEDSKNSNITDNNAEVDKIRTEDKKENQINRNNGDKKEDGVKHKAKDKEDNSNKKVNINKAGVTEMVKSLKGIGPSKAKLIVLYRKSKGNFSNIEEIKNVKGIGNKVFDNIKDKITV